MMRISDISAWAECEAQAMARPPKEARVAVAAWVGTLAHAYLLDTTPETPGRLRFDAGTQTADQAIIQANAIAEEALRTLDAQGWAVMEKERPLEGAGITGHLDILAWHSGKREHAIIDLKTGQQVGAGWLQVGGYLSMWSQDNLFRAINNEPPYADTMPMGGILHVPRVAVSREAKGNLDLRPGHALAEAWGVAKARIDAVLDGAPPLRTPGYHCRNCPANCPVRALD